MSNATKTILIVTANDPDDRLASLAEESKNIQYTLNNVPNKDFNLVLLPEATTADIIKTLNARNQVVEVLHYAEPSGASLGAASTRCRCSSL